MPKSYLKWFPAAFGIGAVVFVIGLVLHVKNSSQATACTTKFNEVRQLIEPTFRATCTTAKSMSAIGTAVMVVGGLVALVVGVALIARYVSANNDRPTAVS